MWLKLSVILVSFLSFQTQSFGTEIPEVEIGVDAWYNRLNIQSKYLTQWEKSAYHNLDIATDFKFPDSALLGRFLKIRYKNLSLCYQYYSPGIDFLEIFLPSPIGSDGYRKLDNTVIHDVESYFSAHNVLIQYKTMDYFDLALISSRFKDSISLHGGPDGCYVEDQKYGTLRPRFKAEMLGFGMVNHIEITEETISLATEAFYLPLTSIECFYDIAKSDKLVLKGKSISASAKLLFRAKNYLFDVGYRYNSSISNNKLFEAKMHGVVFGIHYTGFQ
ncbi:MAG: hypothetical protein V1800_08130 [Candidatus Latescibacterota bacterium]